MDFIILDKNLDEQFQQISRRIRRLQSGGTIDSLQALGVSTEQQIGASFVSLKTLAGQYHPDEKLSLLLWRQKKREEQIMACFLFPEQLNREIITQLISACVSFELAEYFGSIFLARHPSIAEIAGDWSESGEPLKQIAALTAAAKHLILHKQAPRIPSGLLQEMAGKNYPEKYVQLVAERYRFKFNKC